MELNSMNFTGNPGMNSTTGKSTFAAVDFRPVEFITAESFLDSIASIGIEFIKC